MRAGFLTSAAGLAGRPLPARPEFAFVGRSNCGKSSLINHFLGCPGLAHTSRTPGRTRLLNYYLAEGRRPFHVVDLPGYGFAKAAKAEREAWARLVRAYLGAGDRPLAVFHLLDIRHVPSAQDGEMSLWLREAGVPFAIAVTKADKVGRPRWGAAFRAIVGALALPPETPFIPTSAARGFGRQEMMGWVDSVLDRLEAGRRP